MISRTLALVALALALTVSSAARADVIPPPGDCAGKAEGAACKDESDKPGACGTITYTRSFTPPFPDAATQTSERSYFGCKTGVAPKSGVLSNSNRNSNGGSGGKSCSVTNVGSNETKGAWLGLALAFASVRRIRGKASRRTCR